MDATGFLDDKPHELPCPHCGATIKTTVGELRRGPTLQCPGGHPLTLDSTDFDAGVREAEREVERLGLRVSR